MDGYPIWVVPYLYCFFDAYCASKSEGGTTAIILYAGYSRYPDIFKLFGGFMLATSLVLYFVPRKMHHGFSNKAADILKPAYFRLLSPVTLVFGCAVIYSVM